MPETGGILTIDDRENICVTGADCVLFIGCLDINFWSDETDGSCSNIPIGDVVEYTELANKMVSMDDCQNAHYDNPLFKPGFCVRDEHYSIKSFQIDSVSYDASDRLLSLRVKFTALDAESAKEISVVGNLTAYCQGVDSRHLLMTARPIPIRFANHYLPLLGIPKMPAGASRSELISQFGPPHNEGGGSISPLANISERLLRNQPEEVLRAWSQMKVPEWIRYNLPSCILRFGFESEIASDVHLMPTADWVDQQGLSSSKNLYCLPANDEGES